MKTLGICIPTYKRPDFLRRCVLSAIEAAGQASIRIFVSDDSTSDVNRAVLDELQAHHPFVHAHRNTVNLGIDDNIQKAVEICDCDFAWLVGEDDTFLPGAVQRMCDAIQSIETPFVFANYAYVGNDPSRQIGTALEGVGPGPMAAEPFLSRHLWAAGFIGACIVRRSAWATTDAAPYKGTYYTHVGRIAEMVADHGSAHVMSDCFVANRVEGEDTFTWKRDSYGVFFGFLSMCHSVAARRPAFAAAMKSAGAGLEKRYRWLSLRLAMRLRSEHAYDFGQYRKYLRGSELGRAKKVALALISVVPPAVFQPLVYVYRTSRRSS